VSDLSSIHHDIISELVENSLNKASGAMETMLKIRMRKHDISFGEGKLAPIPEFDQLGRFKVHVVRVRLKGEIGGAFYFLINAHEVDLINQVCLPEGMNAATLSENKMMKHGFMSEIENMIASLSIGEISDFLGVQLLSDVPEVQIMQGDKVNAYLRSENASNRTAFYVRTNLSGVVVNISPYFIWMLDDQFAKTLKLNIVS